MPTKDITEEKFILDLSLRRIEGIIRRGHNYNFYGRNYYYPRQEGFFQITRKSGDYEGNDFSEDFSLEYFQGKINSDTNSRPLWKLCLVYCSTSSDIYDYTDIIRPSRSTAYKMKPSGPAREVRFRLTGLTLDNASWAHIKVSKERMQRIYDDLLYLEECFDFADMMTRDIDTWASSGMAMIPFCHCHALSVISNERVLDFSKLEISLDQLKRRLKCSKCGKNPEILVPPDDCLTNIYLSHKHNKSMLLHAKS